MKTHIETITKFIADQMDGGTVPCSGSDALHQLSEAVEAIQKSTNDTALQSLGLKALGAVINRVRSNIAAERTLHAFIRPGGDHV